MTDSLISLEDAAQLLGYTTSGLRKIVARTREGKPGATIRFFQVGRGPIRFRPEWIDEFVAANTVVPQQRKRPTIAPRLQQNETRHWRRPA